MSKTKKERGLDPIFFVPKPTASFWTLVYWVPREAWMVSSTRPSRMYQFPKVEEFLSPPSGQKTHWNNPGTYLQMIMLKGEALALEGVVPFKASCMRTGNQVKESIKNPNQTEPQRLPTKLRKTGVKN